MDEQKIRRLLLEFLLVNICLDMDFQDFKIYMIGTQMHADKRRLFDVGYPGFEDEQDENGKFL
jgi:hypothetical protein